MLFSIYVLTQALLGVATPSDLIQAPHATPFNIGQAIELKGFQLEESFVLAQGLTHKASNPGIALQEILYWTAGQPFLTQKLCWLVANAEADIAAGEEARRVGVRFKQKVFHLLIVMNIITMLHKISFIPNQMLPKSSLPEVAFSPLSS